MFIREVKWKNIEITGVPPVSDFAKSLKVDSGNKRGGSENWPHLLIQFLNDIFVISIIIMKQTDS